MPRQRANGHKVSRTLGRKFAFQSTCFCCYQAPLQNLSGDGSVLENIDFFILSRGGKSLCVNKIREHVQWKHTWSIKHDVKQLLLKCHSKAGPQTSKKKDRNEQTEPSALGAAARRRRCISGAKNSKHSREWLGAAATILIHVYVRAAGSDQNTSPQILMATLSLRCWAVLRVCYHQTAKLFPVLKQTC